MTTGRIAAVAQTPCPECGIPGDRHHDIGCSMPCYVCKRARFARRRNEVASGLGLAAVGMALYWLLNGHALAALHGAVTWGIASATGCFYAMGRQRRIERGQRR